MSALSVWVFLFHILPIGPVDQGDLSRLLNRTTWICYDPSDIRLDRYGYPTHPSVDSIEGDLKIIKQVGFDGIVTFGSVGVLAKIPAAASHEGLRVIMGIWDPRNLDEVNRAIHNAKFVGAYCVGHDGLFKDYSLDELRSAIRTIKQQTGLPVSTTEEVRTYIDDEKLCNIGDWLFPDAHLPFATTPGEKPNADVGRDINQQLKLATTSIALAQKSGHLVALKCMCYPHIGIEGASPEKQLDFFRKILGYIADPVIGPGTRVAIMPLGAFDSGWKVGPHFSGWDAYTGLIQVAHNNASGRVVSRHEGLPLPAALYLTGHPATGLYPSD